MNYHAYRFVVALLFTHVGCGPLKRVCVLMPSALCALHYRLLLRPGTLILTYPLYPHLFFLRFLSYFPFSSCFPAFTPTSRPPLALTVRSSTPSCFYPPVLVLRPFLLVPADVLHFLSTFLLHLRLPLRHYWFLRPPCTHPPMTLSP